MNLILQADWPLVTEDYDHRPWLTEYVRNAFNEVRPYVLELTPLPDWDALDGQLTVHLHWGAFGGNSGLMTPLGPKHGKIEVDWSLEDWQGHGTRHKIVRHEMQHFLGWCCPGFAWGEFGHGKTDDPYRIKQQSKLDFMYHGDLKLVHVSEDL